MCSSPPTPALLFYPSPLFPLLLIFSIGWRNSGTYRPWGKIMRQVRTKNQTAVTRDTMKGKSCPWTLNISPHPPRSGCGPSALEIFVLSREENVRPGVVTPGDKKTVAAIDSDRDSENKECCFLPASYPAPLLRPMLPRLPELLGCQTLRAGSGGPPKRPLQLAACGPFSQHVSEFTSQRRKHMLLGPIAFPHCGAHP